MTDETIKQLVLDPVEQADIDQLVAEAQARGAYLHVELRRAVPAKQTPPRSKFFQYMPSAEQFAGEIIDQGGFAWIEDDFGMNMSGREEYMGKRVRYFTMADVEAARSLRLASTSST